MLLALHWDDRRVISKRYVLTGSITFGLAFFALISCRSFAWNLRERQTWSGLKSLSSDLSAPSLQGVMLTTESGLIPYYSRWIAYDSWGLNTPEFTHRIIQPDRVVSMHPDLAIVHLASERECRLVAHPPETFRDWTSMTDNVQSGLVTLHDYDVWRVPYGVVWRGQLSPLAIGTSKFTCWYVSRSFSGRERVEDIKLHLSIFRSAS
jgi:hypothetical protein